MRSATLKTVTLVVLLLVFPLAAAIVTPSADPFSMIAAWLPMGIVYGLLLLIVSRFKGFAQTPESVKALLFSLAGALSVTLVCSILFFNYAIKSRMRHRELLSEPSEQVDSHNPPEAAPAEGNRGNM